MTLKANGLLLLLGAGLILFGLVGARLGFFIIDEVIYVFGAETFAATGGFTLENGLHLGTSGDLFLSNLLTHGPNGITSQYPPGTAVVWAPLVENFGIRGIIVFNAVGMAGAVAATYVLARQLFGDKTLALWASLLFLFGTFALEYAYVIWPHSVSILTVMVAFILLLRALDDTDRTFRYALLSGLVLGGGLLFRMDNVLLLPVFAILSVLYAARFVPLMVGGLVGFAIPLIPLAIANLTKFGSLNPLSYGAKAGGGTNLSAYVPFAMVLVALLLAVWLIRMQRVRLTPLWAGCAALGLVAAVALVPELQSYGQRLIKGIARLIVDARGIPSQFLGVQDMPDGTRSFWGLSKKALGQSLPWLGVLAVLLHPRVWAGRRREVTCALIFCTIFMLPFLLRNWHGGMSSNMRYFLPVLPVIAILAVLVIRDLFRAVPGAQRSLGIAVVLGVLSSFAWFILTPSGLAGAHQIWALYVFAAVVATATLFAVLPAASVARATLLTAGIGIGVSLFNTATDTLVSQLRRGANETLTVNSTDVAGKALIYGRMLHSAMRSPDQILAAPQIGELAPDPELIRQALSQGYRVLMPEDLANMLVEAAPQFAWQAASETTDLIEVIAPDM